MLTDLESTDLEHIDIPDTDSALLAQCDVSTFRATGPGGQSVNTTDSAVRLAHKPSGITVTCRRQRSQYQNKAECLRRLRALLEAANRRRKPRVATREPAAVRRRVLDSKRRRSRLKAARRQPSADEG